MSAQTFIVGESQKLKVNGFTRTGYSFKGWAKSSGGNVAYSDEERITVKSGLTLYAVWEKATINVTFNANGGSGMMSAQSFKYNESQKLTANRFMRTGYSFKGWAKSSSGRVAYSDEERITITSGLTLYAVWEKATISVTFNANGGNGTMSAQSFTYNVSQKLVANSFTRTGCSFKGWAKSSGGSVAYSDEERITITSDLTLYAVWEKATISVTFNANGGSGTMSSQSFTYNVSQKLIANSFTRTGYSFKGWSTSSGGSVVYSDGQSVSLTSGLTLYAVWEKATLSVTFNANGGSGAMSSQSFTYNMSQKLVANRFTRTGYSFKGWATSSGGSVVYSDGQSVSLTSDLVLYAVWENESSGGGSGGGSSGGGGDAPAPTYCTVTFNSNGGSGTMSAQVFTVGVSQKLTANTYTYTGYTFKGWATSSNGDVVYADGQSVSFTFGVTLYAVWETNTGTGIPTFKISKGVLTGVELNGATDVVIPRGVISIGPSAFKDCSNLKSVMIPESVTSIGFEAFSGCSGLTDVTIPNRVTSIGAGALWGCSGLTSVMIPKSVTNIGAAAFGRCNSLTNMVLPFVGSRRGNSGSPDSLFGYVFEETSYYGASPYMGCVKIQQIIDYGGGPYYYIPSSLKSVTISDETVLGYGALSRCSGLTSVTIPDSVTCIGPSAFSGCSGLTSVTIPDGVTSIGDYAFSGCSGLTSVTIPDSVTSIGEWAFSRTPFFNSQPDGLVIFGKIAYKMKGTCPTAVTIPDGVVNISSGAFRDCRGLCRVTIPSSVTSIGISAFYNCGNLTSVTIPDSVTSIGDGAFSETPFYNSQPDGLVIFGNIVHKIKGNCPVSVTIPDGVTRIGDYAFYGCSGLTSVTIPNSVKSIGAGAFDDCSSLTSVTIPNSVTNIGNSAFWDCSCLTSVTIPDGMTSIEDSAFCGCSGLTSVMIPDSVTHIGFQAFASCSSLTSVTIPDSVTTIGGDAFWNCGSAKFYVSDSYDGPTSWRTGTMTKVIGLSLSPSSPSREFVLSAPTKLSVTCLVERAELRYTTDGSTPTMESPIFQPFTAKSNVTVTVGAFVDGNRVLTTQGKYWLAEVATPEIAVDGSLTFTGSQTRKVSLSCGTEGAAIHYTVSGEEPTEASPVYQQPFTLNLAAGEVVTICARAFKADCKPSEIAASSIYREWTIGDGVNSPALAFATGGDASWARDVTTGHDDGESLRSGTVADGQSSCLELSVDGAGQMSFWWKTSCEATDDEAFPWDHVEFLVDGVRVAWLDGEKDWSKVEWSIKGEGTHVLRWVYVKDDSNTVGRDCAWLDDVKWKPDTVNPDPDPKPDPEPMKVWTVRFDAQGGVPVEMSRTVTNDYAVGELPVATWDGHTFNGWFTVSDGGSQVSSDTIVTTNVTFYAHWAAIPVPDPEPVFHVEDGVLVDVELNGVTEIVIPAGVVSIGDEVFGACYELVSVTFPSGLTNVGECAFCDCTNLTRVIMQDGLVDIGDWAFCDCSRLTDVTIPASVTNIGEGVFSGCTGLKQMMIPDGVMNIGDYAFDDCSGLTDVTIPASVTSIGAAAFGGCSSLKKVALPETLKNKLSDGIFEECSDDLEITYYEVKNPNPAPEPDPVVTQQVWTVTFDAQGGVVAEPSRVVTNDCAVGTLPVATWDGHTFDGWFTAADGDSQVSSDTLVTTNVTFYAHWKAIESVEQTLTIPRAGWNLVSFNVLPDDPSPEAVFADVADSIQSVVSGTRRWTPQSGGRLAALQIGVGYWVKTTRDNVVWTIRGKPDVGVEIRVNQGWNLIGYPLLEAGSPEAVLKGASEAGIVSSVVSGTRRWTPQSGGRLTEMTPGVGYWLKATKAGMIKFDR